MFIIFLPEDELPKEENTRKLNLLFFFNIKCAGNTTGMAKLNTL